MAGSHGTKAEATHSVADAGNRALLLGGKKARREATRQHPFGYGRQRYIYAVIVSIVLETLSFRTAIQETHKVRGDASYSHFIPHAQPPGLPVILFALVLAVKTKSLLLGASATAKSQARIVAVLGATTASERVRHLKTLHVDPRELLVAAKSGVAARDTAKQVAAAVDGSEAAPP